MPRPTVFVQSKPFRTREECEAAYATSTECSLCGEDVQSIGNLEEKIEATRAAYKLKNALGRTW